MYHCHIRFYFIGDHCRVFDMVQELAPLDGFTHTFSESRHPEKELTADADVILANLQGMDGKEELTRLLTEKKQGAELILLVTREQIPSLAEELPAVGDLWTMPMPEEEIRFRCLKWQRDCKLSRDYWETSHFLDATINHMPNLVWYKDKDGVHKKVNDSFCKTVNKSKEQVEGQRHAYIWDVEYDDPVCIESEREVMEKRETCVFEEIVQSGDGVRVLTTYKSPLYDLDGSVMGTVGVGIDITQERAYERELMKKSRTLEAVFMSMDCGIMTHSLDGSRILSVNQAALRILGYDSGEDLLKSGFDLIADSVVEEDKERVRGYIRSLKKAGDSVSMEYSVQHKDGKILHVMGNVKILEENGELFYQRFLLDCTAQKLQEEKNERHQMELIHALSIEYEMVTFLDLTDGRGIPLRVTEEEWMPDFIPGKELILEESREHYIRTYIHEDDRDMMREASSVETLERELAEKKLYGVNYRIRRDGKVEYYQMKAVRAGDWEETKGVVLGFRSVDEEIRKEMEQKNLLEDALLQANRANKAKSTFLSNMSHDIRTPMNAIVGFTALAITHIDRKERVVEYLKKIMTSGNHLLSLINDVLDMSRIESGKMHLEEKPCRLPDILHGLRNIVQPDVHAKRLELYIDTVDVVDEDIYCDKLRLNQVLLNLLSNCVKYTGAGGIVSMRITQKPGAPAGYANYEFVLRDTGIGMSEEFVTHIFEPFEREKNTTISGIQGTGLGMAITKNIVDMMNGTITVMSKEGSGTEFTVNLTFRLNEERTEQKDIPELKGLRALVVDDDFNTCDSVSYMLQQIGLRAEWTLSGKEAILRTHQAVTRGDDYSVYIIDWMLPDMNGVEVTRQIRREMGEHVSIIVLTAYDWSDIEDEAREAGVSAFCSKPLFLSELRNCLHSIVANSAEEEEAFEETLDAIPTGRILLAEDNELNQEIAEEILGDAGFTTEIAGNGRIAVEMLKNSEPGYYQVVLMDVQMPVMNGYEAVQEIRKLENPALACIPVIAMTANAFDEDRQRALECGMDGHIAKPIDIDVLFSTLKKVLSGD